MDVGQSQQSKESARPAVDWPASGRSTGNATGTGAGEILFRLQARCSSGTEARTAQTANSSPFATAICRMEHPARIIAGQKREPAGRQTGGSNPATWAKQGRLASSRMIGDPKRLPL